MAEPIGEAYVRIRPKADTFKADTKRALSGIQFGDIAKGATAGVTSLVSAIREATGAAESQRRALGLVADAAERVAPAARSAAASAVVDAIKVEDALHQEVAAYKAVAEASVLGSREQVAATNLAIQAEERLARSIRSTVDEAKRASTVGSTSARGGVAGGAAAGAAAGGFFSSSGFKSGARLGAGIGIATVAFQALKSAIHGVVVGGAEFETEMNTFQAVTGASAGAMARAAAIATKLGQDVKLPSVSAADAAAAMTELAKGGLSVKDSLAGVRGALELGTAANTDFGTSAEIIARNLSAFGLAGNQATKIADLLSGASIAATGEVSDMALALQQSGAAAHLMGLSVQDTVTSIALLAQKGLIGSDAGTSLRVMLLRLIPTSKKAAEKMSELGVKVLDAKGSLLPLPKILESYRVALAGISQAQRTQALTTIFGQDAIRAATLLTEGGSTAFERLAKTVTKAGEANVLTSARTKGLAGSFGALHSNLETIGIALAAKINPTIKQFVDFFNRGLSVIPQTVGAIRAAFAQGGLTGGISKIKDVFVAMTPAARIATVAVGGLAIGLAALAASAFPITASVIAIAALTVGLKLAYDHSERFRSAVDRLKGVAAAAAPEWQQFRQTVTAAVSGVADVVQSAARVITAVWAVVGHRVTIIVRASFGEALNHVRNVLKDIEGLIDLFAGILTLNWGKAWHGLKLIAKSGLDDVTGIVSFWGRQVGGIFQGVWKSLEEEALRGVEAVLKVIARIPTSFKIFGTKIGFDNPAKAALASVQGALAGIRDTRSAKEIAAAVADNTAAALAAKTRDLTTAVELPVKKAVQDGARRTVKTAIDAGGTVGKAFQTGVDSGISDSATDSIASLQRRLRDAITETAQKVKDAVISAQRNLATIGSGLEADIEKVVDEGPLGVLVKRLQAQLASRQSHAQSKQLRQAIIDAKKELAAAQGAFNAAPVTKAQHAEVDKFLLPKRQALASARAAWTDFTQQTVVAGLQSRQTAQKAAVQKRLASIVDEFNRGAINVDVFSKRLSALVAGRSADFKVAGKTLGTVFANDFNDQVAGLLLQAKAIQGARDKGVPGFFGKGSAPDVTQPLVVLNQQLKVQQDIRDELRRARTRAEKAAAKAAAKTAAKAAKAKSGGSADLSSLSVGATG